MNKQTRDALEMALEALLTGNQYADEINACKEALEQPAPPWKVITKQEIIQADNASNDLHAFARAIDQILKEKNSTISAFCKHGLPRGMCRLGEKDCD
jgi:hypothetical protein